MEEDLTTDQEASPDQNASTRRLVFLASLDESRASLARGEGRVITRECENLPPK
jgi:hypothetical protein